MFRLIGLEGGNFGSGGEGVSLEGEGVGSECAGIGLEGEGVGSGCAGVGLESEGVDSINSGNECFSLEGKVIECLCGTGSPP